MKEKIHVKTLIVKLDSELIKYLLSRIAGSYIYNDKLYYVANGSSYSIPLGHKVKIFLMHNDSEYHVLNMNDENFARVYQPNAKLRDLYQEK